MNPKDHVVTELIVNPQSIASNGTVTANWDLNGRGSWATIFIPITSANTNADNATIQLLESDDTVVTNFATIVANVSHAATAAAATQAVNIYEVDLRGRKRYLRLSIAPGNNDTNDQMTVAAVGRIHHLYEGPTNTSDMVSHTHDVVTIV